MPPASCAERTKSPVRPGSTPQQLALSFVDAFRRTLTNPARRASHNHQEARLRTWSSFVLRLRQRRQPDCTRLLPHGQRNSRLTVESCETALRSSTPSSTKATSRSGRLGSDIHDDQDSKVLDRRDATVRFDDQFLRGDSIRPPGNSIFSFFNESITSWADKLWRQDRRRAARFGPRVRGRRRSCTPPTPLIDSIVA